MKDILGLNAKYVNSRIYDLRPELFNGEKFDLVFMGALLMHVRDPIGALMAERRVCKGKMITNSLKSNSGEENVLPIMEFLNSPSENINWWRPNKRCLNMITEAAGFSKVKIENTVDLITDKVFVDKFGRSSGVTQTLYLVEAEV
jgi:ubiquinone/menaquinone biosynthesis C-methylase UbiE